MEDQPIRALVLAKYLSGVRGPAAIASSLGVPNREEEINAYLRSAEFNTHILRARKDMAASVVDAIKAELHIYLASYRELALHNGDPRVRAQVLKDLLDRGGTGATAKVALTTPEAYRKAIEEYLETEEKPALTTGDPDSSDPSSSDS